VTTVITALREGRALLSPLHAGPSGLPPHIDVVAPWLPPDGTEPKVLGAMVFRCNLRQFLYPLIQSWPTPSASAESLLVRRDGEAVLFLNDLRYQKDTALKLRILLGCKDLPAALAAQGREGIVQGPDYRGVGVLAAVKAVPESPWFVVAKIDAAEVFAGWHLESALIVGLIGGTLIATMVTAAAVC
jgi:two-component system cell cycle sensor histidine kinase/response regulator CckA